MRRYAPARSWISRVVVVVVVVGTAAIAGCKEDRAGASPPGESSGEASTEGKLPRGRLSFEGGPTVKIEIARAPEETRLGLSYRESLCPLCGLYFIFPEERTQSFWMRRMQFPIDILWIGDGVVVGVSENLPPPAPGAKEEDLPAWRSPVPVRHVLEVPAGFAQTHRIHAGMKVRVTLGESGGGPPGP